jgi:glycosyltransferase involved in cell wall biosynthesis
LKTFLLVANFDSNAGYAWWLMESFWAKLANHYHRQYNILLAYPSISILPTVITNAPIKPVKQNLNGKSIYQVFDECRFLRRNQVWAVYFSDRPTYHWRYALYRLCGVKLIIVHDHTPGMRTPARGIKGQLKRIIHRLPWIAVDGAIGATEFVRQRLIQANGLPSFRCHAAPNGLPPRNQVPKRVDLHSLFGIPPERKVLVMTGRANLYKGIDFVLQCLSFLKTIGNQKLHFLFIGDGPDLYFFKIMAKELTIASCCTFAGRRNDITSLIDAADIAIHSSKGEVGYSLSILEYMQAGLPVVVPDNPSVCGIIEHDVSGLIYPEGNVQAASSALHKLLNDESLRNRIGTNARLVSKKYTLEKTHKSLLEAFKKIEQQQIVTMYPWDKKSGR